MKKKIFVWLVVLLSLLLVSAVVVMVSSHANERISVTKEITYEVNNAPDGIEFSISESSSEGITCTLQNQNDDLVVSYSSFWAVQVKIDEKWYAIEEKEREPVLTYIFPMEIGEEVTVTYNWVTRYGMLPRGHYRIVRAVCRGAFPHETPYRLAVEFDIE